MPQKVEYFRIAKQQLLTFIITMIDQVVIYKVELPQKKIIFQELITHPIKFLRISRK